jgi:hypothetical protein
LGNLLGSLMIALHVFLPLINKVLAERHLNYDGRAMKDMVIEHVHVASWPAVSYQPNLPTYLITCYACTGDGLVTETLLHMLIVIAEHHLVPVG